VPDPTEASAGIDYDVSDAVARITINRPARLNALDRAAIVALTAAFERASAEEAVRVVVLSGTGERAFSAGADIKEMAALDAGAAAVDSPRAPGRRLFESILLTDRPTIAAINGLALGVGCEVALACDLRLAATGAVMGLPEAKLGLASMFGSIALPRLLPSAVAARMLFTGESIDAEEALRWGLVNTVVPLEDLEKETNALARTIAGNAPLSLRAYKKVRLQTYGMPYPSALHLDIEPDPFTSSDRREGVRAALEKRPPRWLGR
jgi:enoyl-CoA hydratase